MNEIPTSNEGSDEADEWYRRLSDRDSSGPSEGVRRAVLRHAAERAGKGARRRVATYAGLAAAAMLAGLLVVPHYLISPTAPVAPTALPQPAREQPTPRTGDAPASEQNRVSRASASQAQALAAPAAASPRAFSLPRAEFSVNPPAALREAARRGDVPAIQRLLAEKLDVNARDADGRTALLLAVLQGRRQAVDALLAAGADPNAADASGTTPLQAAVGGAHPAIAAALERAGAR